MNNSLNSNTPEISVLISCYNASRWLHEAINSVLKQTYENFELILVDDGSEDETWNIIQSYQKTDNRIVTISKKNTGLADSLNVGISQARGKWIARLDADDLCEVTRLEKQLAFVRNHPEVILLGTGFLEIDAQDRIIKKNMYPSGHRQLVKKLERLQRFFPHSSTFYCTEKVRQVGGYNLRIRRAEDKDLWLKLALHGKIACLPKALIRMRKHSGQISHTDNGQRQLYDGIAATVCHFLRESGCKDPSISENVEEWEDFLSWLENCVQETALFQRNKVWDEARTEYFNAENRLMGTLHFHNRLHHSGYFLPLIMVKIFGSSLPKCLAKKWIKKSCPIL
jgi:glycosyltransferase involved in cell wall biosynthesis